MATHPSTKCSRAHEGRALARSGTTVITMITGPCPSSKPLQRRRRKRTEGAPEYAAKHRVQPPGVHSPSWLESDVTAELPSEYFTWVHAQDLCTRLKFLLAFRVKSVHCSSGVRTPQEAGRKGHKTTGLAVMVRHDPRDTCKWCQEQREALGLRVINHKHPQTRSGDQQAPC
jgi:hypothetical protein